ncbi:unnamed protein product [Polarella glacialis]|uniref:Pentatricopeptide repeat-containing protein, chloroplastic n=1 Tax=Polarella glacialis TaxID=89957 RepID=A0A813FHY5_POLGL|nr:unnamed protein product [Polarella glacialis]
MAFSPVQRVSPTALQGSLGARELTSNNNHNKNNNNNNKNNNNLGARELTSEISGLCRRSSWNTALSLFDQARRSQTELDLVCCNAALGAFAKGGRWQEALQLLTAGLAELRLAPDAFSFASSVSACEKGSQWEPALALLTFMAEEGLRPNIYAASAAVSACEKSRRWEHAIMVLGGAKLASLEPNAFTCSAAISACEKCSRWPESLLVLSWMRQAPQQMSAVALTAALTACARGECWSSALRLFAEMRPQSVEPSLVSVNSAASACERGARWREAQVLLDEAQSAGMAPDILTYSATIGSCAKDGQWRQAVGLLSLLQRKKLHPDAIVLGSLTLACGLAQQWAQALALCDPGASTSSSSGRAPRANAVVLDAALESCSMSTGSWAAHTLLCQMGSCLDSMLQAPIGSTSSQSRHSADASHVALAIDTLLFHGCLAAEADRAYNSFVVSPVLSRLLWLRASTSGQAFAGRLQDSVLERQCGLGAASTASALRALGTGTEGCQQLGLRVARAALGDRLRPGLDHDSEEAVAGLGGPSAKGLVAWTACSLRPKVSSLIACRGHAVAHGFESGVSAVLPPVFVEHDRAQHVERQALLSVLARLPRRNDGAVP